MAGRVLHGGSSTVRVGTDTAARVQRAALELGYRPNAAARAVRSGRFDCLALLTGTAPYRSLVTHYLLAGLGDACRLRRQHLTLAHVDDERLGPDQVPALLSHLLADGLILNFTHDLPEHLAALVERHRIAHVWLNRRLAHGSAHPDDVGAGLAATRALIAAGHRRIAFVASHPSRHGSEDDRWSGYRDAMRGAGLEARRITGPEGEPTSAWERCCGEWLAAADRPTAIVAYRPTAAYVAHVVAERLGLRVPSDLSIATFESSPATETGVALSTWLIPEAEYARAAVELLLARIDQPTRATPSRCIAYTSCVGDSIAPPSPTRG